MLETVHHSRYLRKRLIWIQRLLTGGETSPHRQLPLSSKRLKSAFLCEVQARRSGCRFETSAGESVSGLDSSCRAEQQSFWLAKWPRLSAAEPISPSNHQLLFLLRLFPQTADAANVLLDFQEREQLYIRAPHNLVSNGSGTSCSLVSGQRCHSLQESQVGFLIRNYWQATWNTPALPSSSRLVLPSLPCRFQIRDGRRRLRGDC